MSTDEAPYIVVVESEASVAESIRDILENRGYQVKALSSGQQALRQVSRSRASLMIIDAELPDMSGYEVCRTTQSMNYHIPVILLSPLMNSNQHADDIPDQASSGLPEAYLKKPIEESQLLKTVYQQIQDHPEVPDGSKDSTLNLGRVQIDLANQSVFTPEGTEHLTDLEVELMRFLSEHVNSPVKRKTLLENVWQYQNTTNTRTVDVHVAKLRSKIEQDPADPEHIITIHGIGYMLQT